MRKTKFKLQKEEAVKNLCALDDRFFNRYTTAEISEIKSKYHSDTPLNEAIIRYSFDYFKPLKINTAYLIVDFVLERTGSSKNKTLKNKIRVKIQQTKTRKKNLSSYIIRYSTHCDLITAMVTMLNDIFNSVTRYDFKSIVNEVF